MSTARDELLARVMTHVAGTGLSDVSLRELADGVGTSHRMLHYHFGGRAGLVAAIVEAMEAQQRDALAAMADGAAGPTEVVRTQWAALSRPEMAPFVRLFFEVVALALHDRAGTEGFLAGLTEPWLDAGRRAGEAVGAAVEPDELRLGVAVMRGLLLDAVASGDPASAGAALERFLAMWERDRAAT
jgi:AcrR family transcriptional regulator